MITVQFLAQWAVRSSILIVGGGLLLWVLRIHGGAIRWAAWTSMLCGSLAIPALQPLLPKVALPAKLIVVAPRAQRRIDADSSGPPAIVPPTFPAIEGQPAAAPFDWERAILLAYLLVALGLWVRLGFGLAMSVRLLRESRVTGLEPGFEVRESDAVRAPVTIGIARPAVLLPGDWRDWSAAKLEAVLAHERSHLERCDPAVQLLSAIHRALLWVSPLSWFLHTQIVRAAEEASDDAALLATADRASYAQVLLDFLRGGARNPHWVGVPMARYGSPEKRIDRILEGASVPRGITRWSVAAILIAGSPLLYVSAAAHPQTTRPAPAAESEPATAAANFGAEVSEPAEEAAAQAGAASYLDAIGSAAPLVTVEIKSRVDGQLMSVGFQEGQAVEAGQVLAVIDPRPFEAQLAAAEDTLAQDQALLQKARAELRAGNPDAETAVAQWEARLKADAAAIDQAKLQLVYTRIASPIAGVAGLRKVDPGNIVHAADSSGIVTITQVQPMAVLFMIPEDALPRVREALAAGTHLTVEAWNRDRTSRIATGRLAAIDNQIDPETATARLKAEFANRNGEFFPNQFVTVRLFLDGPAKQ